jgi:hypothetical protein
MLGNGGLSELQRNNTSKSKKEKSKKSKDKDESSRSKSKSKSKKHKRRDDHPGITPGADPAGPSEKPSSLE